MKFFLSKILVILLFLTKSYKLYPSIYLKILNNNILLDEFKLNFLFFTKYSKIISKKEFSSIYKISYIYKDSNYSFNSKWTHEKKERNILLFDSFSTFSNKKACNISNIIILPDRYMPILNKDLLIYFDCMQFIFFVTQEEFDNLIEYDFHNKNNGKTYVKIFIPEEISKNFVNNINISIPQFYFVLMFITFVLFFFYLFHYNFLVPLLYKDFWLFFISQFYLFIPLRFILLILLSIKLIILQNIRGILPSAPGFFVILAVQKSLIKTNLLTMIFLANEGLYIFENMRKIVRKMTIYKLQFLFLTIILIILLSFPFHLIIIILNSIFFSFIIIHAFVNFKKLRKTLKIAFLTNKRYIPFIKLKLSIWIKQNILLIIYMISIILIFFYSKFSTSRILMDEIICLKCDMLEYCIENVFLFAFCYLYRPRHLERHFFIVYTEKIGNIYLKFYYTELQKINNIKNIFMKKSPNKYFINKSKGNIIKIENFKNKPIIILNPRFIFKTIEIHKNKQNKYKPNLNDKFAFSVGKII